MRLIKVFLWIILAVLAAYSYGIICKIVNPDEPVNAIWLVTAAACTFVLAYRFYGKFLATKVFALNNAAPTPAVRLHDGRDYHPTNRWILLGHHFAAIAGAGPLIGPILAVQFGYMPGALWILIGAVFAGAVHDFVVLVASMRHNGHSIAEIAYEEIGPYAGVVTAITVLFIIIMTLAGFGVSVVNALNHSPWGAFTVGSTIPIALFMGFYLYKIRPGKIAETSIIGILGLFAAVIGGGAIKGSILEPYFTFSRDSLVYILALFGFVASVLPVWMLLCPRDYLCTYMKIATISLLALGVVILAPDLQMAPVTVFATSGDGPVLPGKLFPFLFITIACGAVSGFHALVASGTTPKMISKETDALPIGFGAMLMEGFVSMMALIAGSILIPGDYFAINSMHTVEYLASIGFPVQRVAEFSQMVGVDVMNRPGGAVSLAVGMASIFANIPGVRHLMAYWYNFALMFEALFILTALDTGTRVARFLVQEVLGAIHPQMKEHSWLPGTIMSSALVVFAWGYLLYTGSIATIWPMFGVANQLLTTIALAIGSTVLIKMGKRKYLPITVLPMLFMCTTTFTAAYQLTIRFISQAQMQPDKAFLFRLDATLVVIVSLLCAVVILDALRGIMRAGD